jgi:hypothetical protein
MTAFPKNAHIGRSGLKGAAAIVDTVQALGLGPTGVAAQTGAHILCASSTATAGAPTTCNGSTSADRKVGVARLG